MSESALDRERRDHSRTKDENQRHVQELQKRVELEKQFRTTAINELLATYPAVKRLFEILWQEIAATHPLRGVPSEDTMRVGHPELNAVESAANQGPTQRSKRWDARILWMAERFDDELAGSQEKKPKQPRKPRCQKRDCAAYDKSLPFGSKVCSVCEQPLKAAA